jgi:hypothetical protein
MSAAYVLAAAANIPEGAELLWSNDDVRAYLAKLATDLDPGDVIDQQMVERIPLTGPHLAEAIGRHLFRAEDVDTPYERCVQVAQLLGDCANRLDLRPDHVRADMLREYAHAVSIAGNAL